MQLNPMNISPTGIGDPPYQQPDTQNPTVSTLVASYPTGSDTLNLGNDPRPDYIQPDTEGA
jgi:hypothetical protein